MTPADYPHPPSYIGDALLFYKIAKSGQHFHQARDAPGEQALQLFAGRRTRLAEDRFAISVLIDAVEHETMHMDIEIGCRTKSLIYVFHAQKMRPKPPQSALRYFGSRVD